MKKNTSKVALITGAARRIGASITEKLHQEGWDVIIHYHQSQREAQILTDTLNQRRPYSAFKIQKFLSNRQSADALYQEAFAWKHQLHAIIHNASMFKKDPVSAEDFEALWTTNVYIPFWLSEAAMPALKTTQGTILNITDIHAEKPLKHYSVYCQTKAALNMQTQSLAKAYSPNIRVNAIAPGAIIWPEGQNELTLAQKNNIVEQTLLKQHGCPEWIAMTASHLIGHPFITGVILKVDGGRHLC